VRAHAPTDGTAKTDRSPSEHLLTVVKRLGPDEVALLALIAERLLLGRRRYGELHLATDRRDFQHEALEEAADLAVYAAAGLLREKRGKRQKG
jgi:hypothetical protein